MPVYLDVVVFLNFLVDFLLLLGTNRLCGYPPKPGRAALAAAVGGIYAGACLLPGFGFLANMFWRTVSLGSMALIAFGFRICAIRAGTVFVLLSMSLGGIALGLGGTGFWKLAGAALCVWLLCMAGFRGKLRQGQLVPVELIHNGKKLHLTALRDTGNTLRDPITGKPVLVVGADVANRLTGLSQLQLQKPAESVGLFPGLRLIPYRAVGKESGLLLALKISQVKIGRWKGSGLVAFAPEGLCPEGTYQALTGGVV